MKESLSEFQREVIRRDLKAYGESLPLECKLDYDAPASGKGLTLDSLKRAMKVLRD